MRYQALTLPREERRSPGRFAGRGFLLRSRTREPLGSPSAAQTPAEHPSPSHWRFLPSWAAPPVSNSGAPFQGTVSDTTCDADYHR